MENLTYFVRFVTWLWLLGPHTMLVTFYSETGSLEWWGWGTQGRRGTAPWLPFVSADTTPLKEQNDLASMSEFITLRSEGAQCMTKPSLLKAQGSSGKYTCRTWCEGSLPGIQPSSFLPSLPTAPPHLHYFPNRYRWLKIEFLQLF